MPEPLTALLIFSAVAAAAAVLFWPDRGLFSLWQQSRRLTRRVLIEDALKCIHKHDMEGRRSSLESIAGALHITADRAAGLVQKMQENELLLTRPDGSLQLTPTGREYALRVIRAHRLWERYLADETGYDQMDWHARADSLEHMLTQQQANDLSAQLGHPTYDPHGDPIPTTSGEIASRKGQPLTSMPVDAPFYIVHIEDEPEAVYAQLVAEGLHPGMEGRVIESLPQRLRLWAGGDEHVLAPIVAANVTVLPLPEEMAAGEQEVHDRLSDLPVGQAARVVSLSPALRGVDRRRLMDLGILRDTVIAAELSKGPGKLTAYRVRGALVALRPEQTDHIYVKHIE